MSFALFHFVWACMYVQERSGEHHNEFFVGSINQSMRDKPTAYAYVCMLDIL